MSIPNGFSEQDARVAAAERGINFVSFALALHKLFGDQSPLWLQVRCGERERRRNRPA